VQRFIVENALLRNVPYQAGIGIDSLLPDLELGLQAFNNEVIDMYAEPYPLHPFGCHVRCMNGCHTALQPQAT